MGKAVNIFGLAQHRLQGCKVVQAGDTFTDESVRRADSDAAIQTANADSQAAASSAEAPGSTCLICGATFNSVEEQRAHFKMDWHRLNVKRKVAGLSPLSEDDAERVLMEDGSSVSGSDSESDEENDTAVKGPGKEPKTVFRVPRDAEDETGPGYFRVWNPVLYADMLGEAPSHQELTGALQAVATEHKTWVIVLSRGGHFAAAVFELRPQGRRGGELATVRAHKTFHRYVTRQGQGGRQSAKDATGKYAKSMGSQLRRHNEASLERDIAELLLSWSQHLQQADLVFVHAPAANAKAVFAPGRLNRGDVRVRRVPFPLGRPTFKEAQRCLTLLATVEELSESDLQPPTNTPPQTKLKDGPDVARSRDSSKGPAVRDGGADAAPAPLRAPSPTPLPELHQAAAAGDAERVAELLNSGADPTVRNERGKTAYEVASEKNVRDSFRRYMAQFPDQWNYHDARIPSPLTDEMADAQAEKKAAKKAKQKERERAAKAAKAAKQATRASVASKQDEAEDEVARAALEAAAAAERMQGKAAKGGKGAAASTSKGGKKVSSGTASGPSQDAKKRELMAAAAEARMKALQAATASQHLW